MPRSRASLVVPVLAAAGRRDPPGPLRSASFSAQMSFWRGSVLPARMSLTRNADCAETARSPSGFGAFQTTLPSALRTSRTIRGGTRMPPLRDRPVRRREVERADLDRAERTRQARLQEGLRAAREADAHGLGGLRDALAADALERPDRRDVQRVLERAPDEHRSALSLVGVTRRPVLAAIELGRDVEQDAARASASWRRMPRRRGSASRPSRAGGPRRRRRRTSARTTCWRCRRGRSRHCRRRRGRRRSGSRARPARRCGGPCRAGR